MEPRTDFGPADRGVLMAYDTDSQQIDADHSSSMISLESSNSCRRCADVPDAGEISRAVPARALDSRTYMSDFYKYSDISNVGAINELMMIKLNINDASAGHQRGLTRSPSSHSCVEQHLSENLALSLIIRCWVAPDCCATIGHASSQVSSES